MSRVVRIVGFVPTQLVAHFIFCVCAAALQPKPAYLQNRQHHSSRLHDGRLGGPRPDRPWQEGPVGLLDTHDLSNRRDATTARTENACRLRSSDFPRDGCGCIFRARAVVAGLWGPKGQAPISSGSHRNPRGKKKGGPSGSWAAARKNPPRPPRAPFCEKIAIQGARVLG